MVVVISAKRLIQMARKWQKIATSKRKTISYQRRNQDDCYYYSSAAATTTTTNKGHFVVYSLDDKRFVVPLKYLSTNVFRELLKLSEEEFGLPSNGPIRLPFDGVFLDYVMSLLFLQQRNVPQDVEKALITSMAACHSQASSSHHDYCYYDLRQSHEQTIIYGF
ncbi:auxin-responsive protein SAUR68-like [Arachis duranensis]|uniref:Auxin-responsive protein SAUR68-like n=1 Tax=Arachis duranensis TaxID=130453 RepID=A0A6P4CJZ6_ARADU|nr:auxin-responsive protein SAUR68-like [Arachis duranensis]